MFTVTNPFNDLSITVLADNDTDAVRKVLLITGDTRAIVMTKDHKGGGRLFTIQNGHQLVVEPAGGYYE